MQYLFCLEKSKGYNDKGDKVHCTLCKMRKLNNGQFERVAGDLKYYELNDLKARIMEGKIEVVNMKLDSIGRLIYKELDVDYERKVYAKIYVDYSGGVVSTTSEFNMELVVLKYYKTEKMRPYRHNFVIFFGYSLDILECFNVKFEKRVYSEIKNYFNSVLQSEESNKFYNRNKASVCKCMSHILYNFKRDLDNDVVFYKIIALFKILLKGIKPSREETKLFVLRSYRESLYAYMLHKYIYSNDKYLKKGKTKSELLEDIKVLSNRTAIVSKKREEKIQKICEELDGLLTPELYGTASNFLENALDNVQLVAPTTEVDVKKIILEANDRYRAIESGFKDAAKSTEDLDLLLKVLETAECLAEVVEKPVRTIVKESIKRASKETLGKKVDNIPDETLKSAIYFMVDSAEFFVEVIDDVPTGNVYIMVVNGCFFVGKQSIKKQIRKSKKEKAIMDKCMSGRVRGLMGKVDSAPPSQRSLALLYGYTTFYKDVLTGKDKKYEKIRSNSNDIFWRAIYNKLGVHDMYFLSICDGRKLEHIDKLGNSKARISENKRYSKYMRVSRNRKVLLDALMLSRLLVLQNINNSLLDDIETNENVFGIRAYLLDSIEFGIFISILNLYLKEGHPLTLPVDDRLNLEHSKIDILDTLHVNLQEFCDWYLDSRFEKFKLSDVLVENTSERTLPSDL